MFSITLIILTALVVGGFIGAAIVMGAREDREAQKTPEGAKELGKKKLLIFFERTPSFTNNDVQKLLGVSDATATRYLEELEKEGKIIQEGKEGRGVIYRLV